MIIIINNEPCTVEQTTTINDIISQRNISAGGTAIAVNGKIVKKENWPTLQLNDGDTLIIIKAAYGG